MRRKRRFADAPESGSVLGPVLLLVGVGVAGFVLYRYATAQPQAAAPHTRLDAQQLIDQIAAGTPDTAAQSIWKGVATGLNYATAVATTGGAAIPVLLAKK